MIYKYRAQDENGEIYDYSDKPRIDHDEWLGKNGSYQCKGRHNENWQTAYFDISKGEPVIIDGILCAPVKNEEYSTNCTHEEFEEHLRKSSCLGEERKHGHYYKDVSNLNYIDFYRICDLYEITDSCTQHALKKLLVLGGRGHKDIIKDTQDVIDTMKRKLEMMSETVK